LNVLQKAREQWRYLETEAAQAELEALEKQVSSLQPDDAECSAPLPLNVKRFGCAGCERYDQGGGAHWCYRLNDDELWTFTNLEHAKTCPRQ
jgi:hypothetical protein